MDDHNPPPPFPIPISYLLLICLLIIYISLLYSYFTRPEPITKPLHQQGAAAIAQGCPPWDDEYSDDDDDDENEEPKADVNHPPSNKRDSEKLPLNPEVPDGIYKPEPILSNPSSRKEDASTSTSGDSAHIESLI